MYKRCINHGYIGTKEQLDRLMERSDDFVKIENAEIYWSDSKEAIAVVAAPEWREYLMGRRESPFIEGENYNDQP